MHRNIGPHALCVRQGIQSEYENIAMVTKAALLIGCNYANNINNNGYALRGCIDDVVNVVDMLVDAYDYPPDNIVLLRDDAVNPSLWPTKANIVATLRSLLDATSRPCDELWIHFSGHGVQARDAHNQVCEAIAPCDFLTAGYLLDTELFALLSQHARCRTLVFFDSCHSGSALNLPFAFQGQQGQQSVLEGPVLVNPKNTDRIQGAVTMISGCRDAETSADGINTFSTLAEGAFTMSFLQALRQHRHHAALTQVYLDTCTILAQKGFTQHPVLSSSTVDAIDYVFVRPVPDMSAVPRPIIVPVPVVVAPVVDAPVHVPVVAPVPVPVANMKPVIVRPPVQRPTLITSPFFGRRRPTRNGLLF